MLRVLLAEKINEGAEFAIDRFLENNRTFSE